MTSLVFGNFGYYCYGFGLGLGLRLGFMAKCLRARNVRKAFSKSKPTCQKSEPPITSFFENAALACVTMMTSSTQNQFFKTILWTSNRIPNLVVPWLLGFVFAPPPHGWDALVKYPVWLTNTKRYPFEKFFGNPEFVLWAWTSIKRRVTKVWLVAWYQWKDNIII